MAVIDVALAGRSYEVRVGTGLLDRIHAEAHGFLEPFGKRAVPIVADAEARRLHGERLQASFRSAGHAIDWYEVTPGECSKSWAELERLTDWLLERGVTRSDHVFALGGGVVGDLVGFACAILKRGCGFVQLPTTLLAQVDSSVGGKTAINANAGKNLIGAFHQPSLVLADTKCLATLPQREMRAGLAEVFKYGLLGDAGFFARVDEQSTAILACDVGVLEPVIAHCVGMKARIVAEDERETKDARALLNLGHTFGHALEAETGFSDKLLHGEAVALGMVLAARFSARRELVALADAEAVADALARAGLPTEIAALGLDCDGTTLARHMRNDKKAEASTVPFILLRAIGEAFVARDVDLADVAAFMDEQLQAH
ncbi:3-dehydroquinate synthase [Alteriqipengyuania lutimaris]|uniref:3-dehydroquinate synthase n=1 Tax=Alteriqipengyuania lutimaris TaxID=1538146 RepID=A0A395LMD7_9SPHN|nr:3-dehydroquinate synthase [Alteriqipengyuania lutimaris]MBB3032680.1 3-dehydroquinate synthase [Alteriqipengyuania lutimaris]RDS78206.1 3-dehydroquinate synthase [Alteriqipengyuania lutimaris]